jgi:hypothetical protein
LETRLVAEIEVRIKQWTMATYHSRIIVGIM